MKTVHPPVNYGWESGPALNGFIRTNAGLNPCGVSRAKAAANALYPRCPEAVRELCMRSSRM